MHDNPRRRGGWRGPLWVGGAALLAGVCLWAIPAGSQGAAAARAALNAGDRVQVSGATLMLETEIWTGNGGSAVVAPGPRPATVILRLVGTEEWVPAGVRMDGLWYINGDAVSAAVPLGEALAASDGEVIGQAAEVIDADGDELVDVVVGVRDHGGKRHLIKAQAQPLRSF